MTQAAATSSREPMASIHDVAEYLGVPLATIYAWRSRHVGPPAHRIGRHLKFRWEEVDQWITDGGSDREGDIA